MSVRNEGVSSVRQQMRRVPQPLVDMGLALMVAVSPIIAICLSPIPGRPPDALAYVLGLTIAALVLVRGSAQPPRARPGDLERKKSERLLLNVLPASITARLKQTEA
jgi:hypothetical protein